MMEPGHKTNIKKWLLIAFLVVVAVILLNLKINLEQKYARPSLYELITDQSRSHIDDIRAFTYQIYSVMIEEVKNDKQLFATIMIIGFLAIGMIVIQIIIAITRLPPTYLARPDHYTVTKKSIPERQTSNERSKT